MIEIDLTVEIHRVRETASHIAFREEDVKGGLRINKWFRKYKNCVVRRDLDNGNLSPFSTVTG